MEELYTPEFIDTPTEHPFSFDRVRTRGIIVRVEEKEYEAVEAAAAHWFASKKKGRYGKGLLNTSNDDPHKTERIGLLGEMAFGKVFHQPVDLRYTEGGDQCDFTIKGNKVDVKTNSKFKNFGPCAEIIAYKDEDDYRCERNCKYRPMDVYLLAYLSDENREEKWAEIVLVGYRLKSFVEKNFKSLIHKSRVPKATHYNVVLPYQGSMSIFCFYNWVFGLPIEKSA